jgi:Gas vesicle protein G
MGLIKELILLPAFPARLPLWVSGRIADEVEREEFSPEAAVKKIDRLEEAKKRGEIDEREAAERQDQILEQQVTRT